MTAHADHEVRGTTSLKLDNLAAKLKQNESVIRHQSSSPALGSSHRFYVSGDAFVPGPEKAIITAGREDASFTERCSAMADGVKIEAPSNEFGARETGCGQPDSQAFKVVSSTLFPPLPLHGPPTLASRSRAMLLRISSFFLSLFFLMIIVSTSILTGIVTEITNKLTGRSARTLRPFYDEERRRADIRRQKEKLWDHRTSAAKIGGDQEAFAGEYPPTEGGKDRILCDVAYYARRVGLDVDFHKVRTEDGFFIDLWHVYDPGERVNGGSRAVGHNGSNAACTKRDADAQVKKPKYPVLLLHGLLQSSGTFCCNDDDSLAFWLCKSGFDVWLGNNRCGVEPSHESLKYSDPRMWSWTIQHMGVLDLPALTSKVLNETGFDKLGLVCHSQGTAQTLVALAKDQRPDLGDKLSVFCALAPAAYAGPLIDKFYFQFIHHLSPTWYRLAFGIHAFIPFMMQMHSVLDARLYGWLGYKVFSYLFDWTDSRWDRGLRNRLFQFAPVFVSAETMRWWLGADGFAKNRCILSTRDNAQSEEQADMLRVQAAVESIVQGNAVASNANSVSANRVPNGDAQPGDAWYNEQVPPFALWVCGNDQLVDGQRLLRRFERGREPHVQVVHSRIVEDYEHLDVIWAMDAVKQVFEDLREVLWKTCPERERCRVPEGCLAVPAWKPKEKVA